MDAAKLHKLPEGLTVRPLRILVLEDLASDAELMTYELRQAKLDYTYRRATTREQFLAVLHEERPDVILSDFHLPGFDGLEALALAQAKHPEVPFIFVSGAMGEEVAIESLKRGATDYVLKDRLSRLGPAVKRALRESEERQERRQAEAALRDSEEQYRLLLKNVPAVVYKGYMDCGVDFVDDKVEELTGYAKSDFDSRKMVWADVLLPEDRQTFKEAFREGLRGSKSYIREYRVKRKSGEIIWIQDRGQIICGPDGQVEYISGVFFDVTDRREVQEALRESENRFASFMRYLPGIAYMQDVQGSYLYVNETWRRVHQQQPHGERRQAAPEGGPSQPVTPPFSEGERRVITRGEPVQNIEEIAQDDGAHIWLVNKFPILDKAGCPILLGAVGIDITRRRRAEEALWESEQRLRFLTSQLLTAQERERKRISMELHDELGQSLAVLKLQVRAIERRLGDVQLDLKADCRELLDYLDGVIDNVRRLSRDLSPAILEDLGLQSALKYLLNGVGKHYSVSHSFEVEDLDQLFTADAQIIIYRIFQECLTNISKHAGASKVSIAIRKKEGLISIVLEDNGTGFDPAQIAARRVAGRGLGLAALNERARMLGGTLEIRSQPGAGTKVTCVIPIGHPYESYDR
jgi:PAS domain S-box-containing protein